MIERIDVERAMFGLAKIYDYQLSKELIDIWTTVLNELTLEEFARGCKTYVLQNNPFFPKPGQIYVLSREDSDIEQEASMIADCIFQCLCSYGGSYAFNVDRAKSKIGEIGWAWVSRQGGWESFCRSVTDDGAVPILKSQCRKSIMGLISRKRRGISLVPEIGSQSLSEIGAALPQINYGSTHHAASIDYESD